MTVIVIPTPIPVRPENTLSAITFDQHVPVPNKDHEKLRFSIGYRKTIDFLAKLLAVIEF